MHVMLMCTLHLCLCEPDLGEALLVDMVHHHYFIVITGWRAPRAEKRQTQECNIKQRQRKLTIQE